MCGIAGMVDLSGINVQTLQQLSAILKHRGPDDEGFLLAGAGGIHSLRGDDTISSLHKLPHIASFSQGRPFLGLMHRRLSILDLSAQGHQPMGYQHKYHLVFNGEIYNYKELRAELENKGHLFHSSTDTEVILAAYAQWGEDCVNRFRGMWAFAVYDTVKNSIFLSRDRFGIKPLYYVYDKNSFAFASEIKALLSLPYIEPLADMKAVYEYVSFGATADPSANLFKQVNVLQPAHNLVVSLADVSLKTQAYYSLEEAVSSYEGKDPQQEFSERLHDSIGLHLRADVEIGSALSGGLDSSTLVAIAAARMNGNNFKTFTAAYDEKNIDESDYAKLVSGRIKNVSPFYTRPSINGFWNELGAMIWQQDLPLSSTSVYAQWCVMKLAREKGVKVLLDGQGADEILGGYYNFAGIFLLEKLKSGKFSSFLSEKKALKENFTPAINTALGRAAYYYLPSFAQRRLRNNRRLGMNFISPACQKEIENISVPERGGKNMREQSLLSIKFGMQDLLRYEDRNSMSFSIESRVPFLDHKLVECSIAMSDEWKIKKGWTKYILRKTAEPLLDKKVVWRKDKMGFITPQKKWKETAQKDLNNFVNDMSIPSFLDEKYIRGLCAQELNDNSRLSEFWKMISFLKWADMFNVRF